jgi:TM2 domain-containing membrane protein YozV
MDNKTLAILGLVLNILVLPGLGSLIGGKKTEGIWQIVIAVVSIPLMLVIIGFFTFLGAWIWSIVTGVQMVQEAN